MTSMAQWEFPNVVPYFDENEGAIYRLSSQLHALSEAQRSAALASVTATMTRHVDEMDETTVREAAFVVMDDLYKAASGVPVWDAVLAQYLQASARPFLDRALHRGYSVHYVVDNSFPDLQRPLEFYPHWFGVCGVVYSCPQLMARHLMEHDGLASEYDDNLPQYIGEARDVANQLLERCANGDAHFIFIDTDAVDDSFVVARQLSAGPGVIDVFRNEAPVKGSSCHVRFPDEPRGE